MINSVRKALDIVGLFSPEEPRLTLAEVSSRLGLPKSTAHNLLGTLQSCGYVERTRDDRYALGKTIIALTQAVLVNVELRDRASPPPAPPRCSACLPARTGAPRLPRRGR